MTAASDPSATSVLLVDDERDALELLEAVLHEDHRLVAATDGEMAWQLLTSAVDLPDLVICDLGMPRMSGDELVVRMRSDPRLASIPVILLTGRDSDASRLEMLDVGVSDYVLKPFRPDELRLRVRNILQDSLLLREVREARAAAEKANRELREVNLELDRFAATAAHDLQAPLSNIAGYAALLINGTVEDPQRRTALLGAIGENAERAHVLVRDLLHHARTITSGDALVVVDLDEVLTAAEAHLRSRLDAHEVVVRRLGPLGRVTGRRVALESLLLNLLSNAIKYRSAERAPIIEVATLPGDDEGFTEVVVQDNGRGLHGEDLERVFGLGVQGSDPEPGTGIGLATVRAVVHRHGGRIRLEHSPDPGGLTVRFTLPGA